MSEYYGNRQTTSVQSKHMGRRLAYMLLGACVGVLFLEMIGLVQHHHLVPSWENGGFVGVALGSATIAVNIAERKGKVKSIRELERPLTLFPLE
jgi:hypothetical protein